MASITQIGGAGQPVMTVSFKMDITTSGTHNGLFITTGIQNGQQAQMKQFGFIQPNQQLPQLMNASQLSIPAVTPTPTPFVTQPSAIESAREETYITKTSFPSTSGTSILNDSQTVVVSPPSQRRVVTTFTNTEPSPYISTTESIYKESQSLQTTSERPKETTTTSTLNVTEQMQRTVSPAPSSIVNRTTDEFLKNVPFKINTFADESRPYVQHPTDMVINDTTTTTTTVEVFRANANDPTIDYYKLPPPPAEQNGRAQLIPARGPAYEVHTNTETRFSDAPIGYSALSPSPYLSAPAQKSVQWDTRTPITILEDDRPDSRYGSHGSIDTILRKQWIENKTETLSPNANDPYPQSSFRGSNRSLVEQPRESTSYTLLDTQATQAIQPRPESNLQREPEKRYITQAASPVVQDPRSRYFEKRRRSPHNSLSPARRQEPSNRQQAKSTTPRSPNSNRRNVESRGHRSRPTDEVRPRQSWEYSSIQKPARPNQARSYQSQTGTQQVPYTIIPQRQRHRSASQLPTLQAAEDYVERPPRQTCVPFRPATQTTTYPTGRSRSKSPPPLATEYGKPTLVYTPRNPNDSSSFMEDDYYGRLREEQVRSSRSRERKSSLTERSRSPSPWEWERPESPNYRMGNRSASSNEIFRLYQTRDCLGNVLYEL